MPSIILWKECCHDNVGLRKVRASEQVHHGLVFLFPAILVRWISLKIILFLNMEDWNAKHDHIWGPSRTPSHGHALQIWLYAALLAVQGCCRLQNLCFPCHFACNHRRSESRQIQAKNSEELFQDCMVGIAATNPVEISANTYSQHEYFVVATSNLQKIFQVSSACLQRP